MSKVPASEQVPEPEPGTGPAAPPPTSTVPEVPEVPLLREGNEAEAATLLLDAFAGATTDDYRQRWAHYGEAVGATWQACSVCAEEMLLPADRYRACAMTAGCPGALGTPQPRGVNAAGATERHEEARLGLGGLDLDLERQEPA